MSAIPPPFWRALAAVQDLLVAPAFGAPGYHLRRRTWRDPDLGADLQGRSYLVTGANGGLGLATCRMLARRGATLHMVARNPDRGEAARDQLRAETGNASLHLHLLDVSDLSAVRRVAEELAARLPALHGLAHNAGALWHERQQSAQGLEQTFATHVAGPFLLTRLLTPLLRASAPARVVFVSSGGMYTQRLDLDTLARGNTPFDGVRAYAQAKRAQVILARRWARRMAGSGVGVYAMHPGWADTPGVQSALPRFHRLTGTLLRTPEQGADTVAWLLSTAEPLQEGAFYLDRLPRREHVPLAGTRSSEEEEGRLWRLCEEIAQGYEQGAPLQPSPSRT